MKKHVLIANKQIDIQYMYADFSYERDMEALFFEFTLKRIGILKVIDFFGLKETRINYLLLFRRIFDKTIKEKMRNRIEDEYVSIVLARAYEKYGTFLAQYLRENYPSCKLALYYTDLLHSMSFSLQEAKRDFDIVCSFDEGEAKKHGMAFVLEPFSTRLLDKITVSPEPMYDVSFVGAAKGRYDKIIELYNNLHSKNLKCDFYIVGVDKKERINGEGLHYEWLGFDEVLAHAANSRCIVEIMQSGGYSATTRYAEAMLLNRNLITDCPALSDSDDKSIFPLDGLEFSAEELCMTNSTDTDKYIEMFSIRRFINTIDAHISLKVSE